MPFKIVSEIVLPLQLFDHTPVLRSLISNADEKVAGIGGNTVFPSLPMQAIRIANAL